MPPVAKRNIVLIGCGHAHVEVLRRFGKDRLPGLQLTMITREVRAPYSGMLPGHIASHYSFDDMHLDAEELCRFANARLVYGAATGLDLNGRRVLVEGEPPVAFDFLSIDIGSMPNTGSVLGAASHALPVKPVDRFLPQFHGLRERVRGRQGQSRIVVVGGGAGGVELLLSVQHRLRADFAKAGRSHDDLAFALVTDGDVLPGFNQKARDYFSGEFDRRGIRVVTGAKVLEVQPRRLLLQKREPMEADEILWVTEAMPAAWLAGTGLALDEKGFIRVDQHLASVSHPFVFAAGDIASIDGRPVPKSGVWAVRQGPPLARNLRAAVLGKSLRTYRPQKRALVLISTGGKHAVADRGWFFAEGNWVWRWKDWIDRRFMRRYRGL